MLTDEPPQRDRNDVMERWRKVRPSKELLALAILTLLAVAVWQRALKPGVGEFEIVFLNVGQGDCAFVRTPGGHTMLIDGGSEGSGARDVGIRTIAPFLRRQGVNRIDVVVVSHPHEDHLAGLVAVIKEFRIGMVVDSAIPHGSRAYADFLKTVRDRRIPYRRAERGQTIAFRDGVRAEVLHPPAVRLSGTGDPTNENSVVLRITCARTSILFTGDAGRAAEKEILASGTRVRSNLLKVAHHGSNDATSDDWLDAVRPRIAVISVGRGNRYGHPSRKVLDRLESRGIRVCRTDRDGAVVITQPVGGKLSVRTFGRASGRSTK